jgi:hypothetical protein
MRRLIIVALPAGLALGALLTGAVTFAQTAGMITACEDPKTGLMFALPNTLFGATCPSGTNTLTWPAHKPTYVTIFAQTPIDLTTDKQLTATCPADHPVATGGGYAVVPNGFQLNQHVGVQVMTPNVNGNPTTGTPGVVAQPGNGYGVIARLNVNNEFAVFPGDTSNAWGLQSWAVCTNA